MLAQTIGDRIKLYRKQRELSQGAFARLLGVNQVSTWRWETGRSTPSVQRLRAISDALQVRLSQLVDDGS